MIKKFNNRDTSSKPLADGEARLKFKTHFLSSYPYNNNFMDLLADILNESNWGTQRLVGENIKVVQAEFSTLS